MKSLKKKGMGYLRGAENDLSSFSKFVQKADSILKKLRVSSSKISKGGFVAHSDNTDSGSADGGEEADDQSDENKEQTPVALSTR